MAGNHFQVSTIPRRLQVALDERRALTKYWASGHAIHLPVYEGIPLTAQKVQHDFYKECSVCHTPMLRKYNWKTINPVCRGCRNMSIYLNMLRRNPDSGVKISNRIIKLQNMMERMRKQLGKQYTLWNAILFTPWAETYESACKDCGIMVARRNKPNSQGHICFACQKKKRYVYNKNYRHARRESNSQV